MVRLNLSAAIVLVCAMVDGILAAEIPTHRQKVCNLPGIPGSWDYRSPDSVLTGMVTAQSLPAVLLETPPPRPQPDLPGGLLLPDPRVKVRYFQLGVRQLAIDHCSLSRVVVAIHDDGTVAVSLRADQNARLLGDPAEPGASLASAPQVVKQVEHLKRNQFHVRIRLLGASGPRETLPPAELGRMTFAEFNLDPFWVQRGEPYSYFRACKLKELRGSFSLIERIEVQFAYR